MKDTNAIRRQLTKKKFLIQTIPHKLQRYQTVGDWEPGNPAKITVSEMGNDDYEFLVMVHELIEFYLCQKHGITSEMVDKFDFAFEKERAAEIRHIMKSHPRRGRYGRAQTRQMDIDRINNREPGDDPNAPYYKEHQFATMMEKALCHELGVNWDKYDKTVMNL